MKESILKIDEDKIKVLINKKKLRNSEIQYLINIAKELYDSRKKSKEIILQIANKVCDLNTHGGHLVNSKHNYTLSHFARDIGLTPKTLWLWKKEYDILYSKFTKEELAGVNRKQIEGIISVFGRDAKKSDIKRAIDKAKNMSKDDKSLVDVMFRAKNIRFFITQKAILAKINQDKLKELRIVIRETNDYLSKYFDKGEVLERDKKQAEALKQMNQLQ